MTSKLDMVKARNLGIISVVSAITLGAGFALTSIVDQQPVLEGSDISQIYAGNNTSFVLDIDGQLWAKGVNSLGQLGVGDFSNKSDWTLVELPESEKVTEVSAGNTHTIMLTENDNIYTFGDNRAGISGNGTTSVSLTPKQVVASSTYSILTAGEGFVIALSTDGNLYGWGANDKGQLGLGDKEGRGDPTRIEIPEASIVSLKAGKDFVVALASDGRVFSWGANDKGQLGLGDKSERLNPTGVPVEPLSFINTNITSSNVVALTPDGRLISWGANDKGQLGNGSDWREAIRLENERVANEIKSVKEADEARKKSLIDKCVDEKTKKWKEDNPPVWEELPPPEEPEIGDPNAPPVPPEWGWVQPPAPDYVPGCTENVTAVFVQTDTSHIVAAEIKEAPLTPSTGTPEHIGGENRFIYASVGAENGSAVSSDEKLFTWGSDAKGQNGNSLEEPSHTQIPKRIQAEDDHAEYIKTETSNGWSIAVTSGGVLRVWGSSSSGALGSAGSKTLTPTDINDPEKHDMVDVFVGSETGYAVSRDGSAFSWGGNASGVLGADTEESKSDSFLAIGSSLKNISPSGAAIVALGNNNLLYGWGTDRENAFGEDSANETVQKTARRIQQITKFDHISAGNGFSTAIDTKGKVWVWGSNSAGINSHGAGGNMLYPVKVELPGDATPVNIQATVDAIYVKGENNNLISWGAGRGFVEMESPSKEFAMFSTYKGISLLTEDNELWRTTYEAPELVLDSEGNPQDSEPFVEQLVKLPGEYSAVSQSLTVTSLAQTSDKRFLTWGENIPEDSEDGPDGTYYLDLSLPLVKHISLSNTHIMMFDVNRILWMWGEEPSGTFKNKGFVKIPQSSIFTPKETTD